MILKFKNHKDGWRFYPANEAAEKFLSTFKCGRGNRMCLTEKKIDFLREIGVELDISNEEKI